jgi:hypothetical protein
MLQYFLRCINLRQRSLNYFTKTLLFYILFTIRSQVYNLLKTLLSYGNTSEEAESLLVCSYGGVAGVVANGRHSLLRSCLLLGVN